MFAKQFYLWFDEVRKICPALSVIVGIVSHFPAHWMENLANGRGSVSMFLKKRLALYFFLPCLLGKMQDFYTLSNDCEKTQL